MIPYLYQMKRISLLLLLTGSLLQTLSGQFLRMDSIAFFEGGQQLRSPFAGGLNQPQFSPIDLNGDLQPDLFVFDRSGNKITTYLSQEIAGEVRYPYAPMFQDSFPQLENWALLRDYDCDGKPDIFTAVPGSNRIRVYKNTSGPGELHFQLMSAELTADGIGIYAPTSDIPAIADVDADGDLDILSFDSGGFFVQYFENTGGCGSLDYRLNTACWGQFQEDPFTNDVYLNNACKGESRAESGGLHSGSTLASFDADGDSALEMLLGDINFDNLVFLHNGGTPAFAEMDQVISQYPDNSSPVQIFLFPAAFFLDINRDNLPDLIAAPNAGNISANFNATWYYEHTGTSSQAAFSLQKTAFLQEDMVDCGADARPVLFDYNGDGLQDIVIGNLRYKNAQGSEGTALTLYQNTGTLTEPAFSLVSRDYLSISSLFNPPILGAVPAFGDLDDDGDSDLLLGDLEGHLHLFRNEAGPGNPAVFVLVAPVFQGLDVGQNAVPQIIDINGDSLPDLLVGEKSGNLNYFENTGTTGTPDFSTQANAAFGAVDVSPQCCGGLSAPFLFRNASGQLELVVGSEQGGIFQYGNIEGNLSGTFALVSDSFGGIAEGTRTTPWGGDLNGDGEMEWIVGNSRGGIAIYASNDSMRTAIEPKPEQTEIRFFPNPGVSPILTLSKAPLHAPQVKVFDCYGRKVPHELLPQGATQWQLHAPTISPGLYLIQIELEGRMRSLKWLRP